MGSCISNDRVTRAVDATAESNQALPAVSDVLGPDGIDLMVNAQPPEGIEGLQAQAGITILHPRSDLERALVACKFTGHGQSLYLPTQTPTVWTNMTFDWLGPGNGEDQKNSTVGIAKGTSVWQNLQIPFNAFIFFNFADKLCVIHKRHCSREIDKYNMHTITYFAKMDFGADNHISIVANSQVLTLQLDLSPTAPIPANAFPVLRFLSGSH
jgi:hypothetical protein